MLPFRGRIFRLDQTFPLKSIPSQRVKTSTSPNASPSGRKRFCLFSRFLVARFLHRSPGRIHRDGRVDEGEPNLLCGLLSLPGISLTPK